MMYSAYICELFEAYEDILKDRYIIYILANSIDDAVDKFKEELIDIIGMEKFNDIIYRFENRYDLSINSKMPPDITFIDLGSSRKVDINYLNDKLKELESSREYKPDSELSNIIKELVLYNKYYIEFFTNGYHAERVECIYYSEYGEIESFRREESDYNIETRKEFEFLSKVRLRKLNNDITYIVTSKPYFNFNSRDWENIYGITQQGYEDKNDNINYEIEIHASELEYIGEK